MLECLQQSVYTSSLVLMLNTAESLYFICLSLPPFPAHEWVSPERYWKEFMDVHNPGAVVVHIGDNQVCYSNRVPRSIPFGIGQMFYLSLATLSTRIPLILLYITWRKQLAALQWIKDTKGGPAVMWACIAWMPLANLYMVVKFIVSISHSSSPSQYQRDDDVCIAIGVVYWTVASSIAAVIQGRKHLPLLPNANVFRSAITRRGVKFHVWFHFNAFVFVMITKSPFAVLLVGTNPFLYGSALLAIVLAVSLPILLTATLFTIGQVFLEDPDFRLTWSEAVRQAGWLLLVATGHCTATANELTLQIHQEHKDLYLIVYSLSVCQQLHAVYTAFHQSKWPTCTQKA